VGHSPYVAAALFMLVFIVVGRASLVLAIIGAALSVLAWAVLWVAILIAVSMLICTLIYWAVGFARR
jgi:hypothetical protein